MPLTPYHITVSLEAYGIDGFLLSWISSFLMGCTQQESVNGSLSSIKPVLSGICISMTSHTSCTPRVSCLLTIQKYSGRSTENRLGMPSKISGMPGEMVRHMAAKIPPG